jgi:ribonucleoside-diphosphate reductase alpha chain
LGLGYANLGSVLLASGLPYDSAPARNFAASVTALLTGAAYRQSIQFAQIRGPFAAYADNAASMLEVMRAHQAALQSVQTPSPVLQAAQTIWREVLQHGETFGFRNAQVTAIAPTGTIGFMMDCDTMGIEPDIALVKYKKLVGSGHLKMVNQTVPLALQNLGYGVSQIQAIVAFLEKNETLEGAPHLQSQHLSVFDCALGKRSIAPLGHVLMMAAVQPFLSGAISKTVNIPNNASVKDILQIYIEAWQQGLKSIAVYRDGSKRSQPLNTSLDEEQRLQCGPTSCDGE